jgi:surface protein
LPGSSGSPIFLIQTTYIIGIHKGGDEYEKKNYGDFIFPIINFLKNENEIKIIIEFQFNYSLFSKEFINKNNDKFVVIINGKNGFTLNSLSKIYDSLPKTYEIILREIKEITNMSFMFNFCCCDCCKIIQIDFSKWDISNITNM